MTRPEEAPRDARPSRMRRRRGWPVVALASVLLAGGVAATAASARLPEASWQRLGPNRPVDERSAAEEADISAHNSPALVVNPKNRDNLAVANRIDLPRFSCGLHTSFDGGARWEQSAIPLPEGEREPPCFSPDLAFGADGVLYLAFTSFAPVAGQGTVPDAIWLARSADGGRTFSAPVQVAGPLAFQMRLLADPEVPQRLYLSWVQSSGAGGYGFTTTGNPIVISRSDDAGVTWQTPVTVTLRSRQRVVSPSPAAGPGGALYVAYVDVGGDALDYHGAHEGRGGDPYAGQWSLVLARSIDSGVTWRESVVEAELTPAQRFLVLFPPAPSVVADDGSDHVHVGFHDGRLGDPDVWLWTSDDGGRRWRRGLRVNDTDAGDATSQYLPELAIAANGRLDVVYYDRRTDRSSDVLTGVSLQSSFDDGRSFSPSLPLSDTRFDSSVGFGRDRDMPQLGDRLGLVVTDTAALAVWADSRVGRSSGKQVLARAVAARSPGSALRRPLRAGGPALALAGAVALVVALRGRRHDGKSADTEGSDSSG